MAALSPIESLDVRCPEWDLVSAIIAELTKWPLLKLQYVPGHQDRARAYSRLSLLAQLNVDADAMASRYQCEFGEIRTRVLLTSTAGVHLITPHGTQTSHYDEAIRHQATYPGLMKYIQTKYAWSDATAAFVNWRAHGSSLQKRIEHKTHFTKLVHDILPTCRQLHRHDPIRRLCPLCKLASEDWQHILRCPHSKRVAWRKQMITKVMATCKAWRTRPVLQHVIRDALHMWLDSGGDPITMSSALYSEGVDSLLSQQNAIGWTHLWQGRFSAEWATLQDDYYARKKLNKLNKRYTGHRWQVAIIGTLWDQWRVLWESRNQDLHGATLAQRTQSEARDVHRDLRDLYDIRHRLDPPIQALFHDDITEHYARPTWVNQNWLAIHAPLIRDNLRQVTARAKLGVRSIRDYFAPQV